ncbi:MAG: 50S ribosomal protein L23 [Candidatus Hydrogenedentes bacterium]|jgi:large subunit ribosomal protein L23|nr:50S ribosomal protein L23 [Candidatus Hydrogenedentota bacterium]
MKADHPYHIVKAPLLSEESTLQSESKNKYTFRVDPRANKRQIKEAIEQLYSKSNIKVVSVNTMNYMGKVGMRRGGGAVGRRPNWKKAIVTLRQGDMIELI